MKNVLLVFGGVSYEHDISIVTAFQIFKKTRLNDYKLVLFYISRDGKFYVCDENKIKITDFAKNSFTGKEKGFKEVVFVSGEKQKLFAKTRFGLKEYLTSEVAIFACHGGDGENGRLVTYFENNGIACSAGSSNALAVCMDKFLFKTISFGLKIPVVSGFKITKLDLEINKNQIEKKLKKLEFPVIIKINSGGSSIGLFIARDLDEFYEKAKEAFEFNDDLVIEKFISGAREFNIAVLGDNEHLEISGIDEPIKNNDVLTFADKYLSDSGLKKGSKGSMKSQQRILEVDLSEEIKSKIKKLAEKIFTKLGLIGIVRIDFLYSEKTGKLYVCEVNTIPGSLAYYLFKKNRVLTNDLMKKLIDIALKNYNTHRPKKEFMVDVLTKK